MFVQSFFVPGLAHLSYLLGGKSTCAIVDPRRDVDEYLSAAKNMGMGITHILETHLHADFVSGHMDLAARTGAEIIAPRAGKCSFPHRPVAEGDEFQIEDMSIRVLDTPGHTPEHITFVVTDQSRGAEPAAIFCGDTLFVGDVGRPDLFPDQAVELAGKLYQSLGKLKALPDPTLVLPAHGAGSLCGRAMGAMRFSAVGYEKHYNRELQHKTLDAFRGSLLTGLPEAPDHFSRCSDINRKGPAKVESLEAARPLSAQEVYQWTQKSAVVLDARDFLAFGGAHIPGGWNIDMAGNYQTFSGWVIPPDQPIVLVLESDGRLLDATTMLRRVGLDKVIGWLDGGMPSWNVAGLPEEHVPQISAQELAAVLAKDSKSAVLDVRGKLEFETLHLNGAVNIPAPDLRKRHAEVPKDRTVYVICNSGHRSSLACSILLQKGFKNITNVVGGMMAFSAAGLVGTCPICSAPHLPAVQGAQGGK
ncbi:MAG: MBL fold metallo-hydrolase [Deltaproteobacteria bacterium SM23_61]|nr:MAG: MBL fold metallo-hydrolase [Deltaproteobacteria bacterium SM23_61]